jgi:hypothetical protein
VVSRLVQLALADGAERVRPLVQALALDPNVPLEPDRKSAEQVRAALGGAAPVWPTRPAATLVPRLTELTTEIAALPQRVRKRMLAVVAELVPELAALAGAWRRWWSLRDALGAEARERLPRIAFSPSDRTALFAVAERLSRLEQKTPVELDVGRLVSWLRCLPAAPQGLLRAMGGALAATPPKTLAGQPRRIAFVCQWTTLAEDHAPFLERWLRALARFVRGSADAERALAPWKGFWMVARQPRAIDYASPERYLFWEKRAGIVEAFFAALAASAPEANAVLLARLCALGCDGAEAARLEEAVRRVAPPEAQWTNNAVLEMARTLAGDDVARFEAVLAHLVQPELADRIDAVPGTLVTLCRERHARNLLGAAVVGGQGRRVLAIVGRLAVLQTLGTEVAWGVGAGAAAAWQTRYPKDFQPLLRRLSAVDLQAEETAARLLGKEFADPRALRAEAAAIRTKIGAQSRAQPRLEQRLANLERRLAEPRVPAPEKLAALRKTLAKRVGERTLDGYQRRLDEAIAAAMKPVLGVDQLPHWLFEPPCIDLLPHLATQETRTRRLAFRVLRARAGPHPWDLRDEGANAAFLATLRGRGVEVGPWLDGIGIVPHDAPRGRLYLQLERDPLEVLRMGAYFETCLSPGGVNFFSTITNAADVNKRVLYARDERGAVQGRVLLCLTREGNVLGFHPYCHDPDAWRFAEAASAFVARLCDRMGNQPVPHGVVPTLLARDWYDDGPHDLTGRFAALQDAELSRTLETLAPGEVVERLRAALGRLDAVTLPLVLAMPPLRNRPELCVALLDTIAEHGAGIPLELRAEMGRRVWPADSEAARSFLRRAVLPDLERAVRRGRIGVGPRALVPLCEIGEASLALRVARVATKGSRAPDPGWLYLMACAHEALRRRQRAVALYRAARERAPADLVQLCEARLAALR